MVTVPRWAVKRGCSEGRLYRGREYVAVAELVRVVLALVWTSEQWELGSGWKVGGLEVGELELSPGCLWPGPAVREWCPQTTPQM